MGTVLDCLVLSGCQGEVGPTGLRGGAGRQGPRGDTGHVGPSGPIGKQVRSPGRSSEKALKVCLGN